MSIVRREIEEGNGAPELSEVLIAVIPFEDVSGMLLQKIAHVPSPIALRFSS